MSKKFNEVEVSSYEELVAKKKELAKKRLVKKIINEYTNSEPHFVNFKLYTTADIAALTLVKYDQEIIDTFVDLNKFTEEELYNIEYFYVQDVVKFNKKSGLLEPCGFIVIAVEFDPEEDRYIEFNVASYDFDENEKALLSRARNKILRNYVIRTIEQITKRHKGGVKKKSQKISGYRFQIFTIGELGSRVKVGDEWVPAKHVYYEVEKEV